MSSNENDAAVGEENAASKLQGSQRSKRTRQQQPTPQPVEPSTAQQG